MSSLLLAAALAVPGALWAAPAPAPAAAPAPAPQAAPSKPQAQLPGEPVEFQAPDGWKISGRYLRAATADRLTLILLHGRGQRKEVWLRLARALARAGYGFLAFDARGHGDSQTAPDGQPVPWRKFKATRAENDYEKIALDVQGAVAFLSTDPVGEDMIGLIGQDLGGSIAIKYAAVHPKIALLVMVSPGLAYQEIPIVNAVRAYKGRPILMIYGEADRTAAASAPLLHQFAKQAAGADHAALISVPGVQGPKLLTSSVVAQIVDWLGNPVPPQPVSVSTADAPAQEPPAAPDSTPAE